MTINSMARYLNLHALRLLVVYAILGSGSYWLAYELRFDFNVTKQYDLVRVQTLWWVLILKLILLVAFGQLDCVLAYFRLPDALRILSALVITAITLISIWYIFKKNNRFFKKWSKYRNKRFWNNK